MFTDWWTHSQLNFTIFCFGCVTKDDCWGLFLCNREKKQFSLRLVLMSFQHHGQRQESYCVVIKYSNPCYDLWAQIMFQIGWRQCTAVFHKVYLLIHIFKMMIIPLSRMSTFVCMWVFVFHFCLWIAFCNINNKLALDLKGTCGWWAFISPTLKLQCLSFNRRISITPPCQNSSTWSSVTTKHQQSEKKYNWPFILQIMERTALHEPQSERDGMIGSTMSATQ